MTAPHSGVSEKDLLTNYSKSGRVANGTRAANGVERKVAD